MRTREHKCIHVRIPNRNTYIHATTEAHAKTDRQTHRTTRKFIHRHGHITHTHAHTHMRTETQGHIETYTDRGTATHADRGTCKDTGAHANAYAQGCRQTDTQRDTRTHKHATSSAGIAFATCAGVLDCWLGLLSPLTQAEAHTHATRAAGIASTTGAHVLNCWSGLLLPHTHNIPYTQSQNLGGAQWTEHVGALLVCTVGCNWVLAIICTVGLFSCFASSVFLLFTLFVCCCVFVFMVLGFRIHCWFCWLCVFPGVV